MWKSTFSVSLIGDDIQTRTVGVGARTVEGTCNAGLVRENPLFRYFAAHSLVEIFIPYESVCKLYSIIYQLYPAFSSISSPLVNS